MARHQAIILKKLPLREDDELVMCYTKHAGKQRYVAKSSMLASSLQGGHLDVLNHVGFNLIEGNRHPIIASAAAIDTFPAIKRSLPALAAAFFMLECFDKLVFENQKDPALWLFLLHELRRPEGRIGDMSVIQRRLVSIMGHDRSARVQELAQRRFSSFQFFSTIMS